jgi:hypothetical protein
MKRALPRGLRGAFCAAILCLADSLPAAADPQQPQQQQQQNQMEMQIGQQEWTQLSQRGEIVQSSQYYPELQQVAQRVAAVADPQYFTPFHFILVNENSPNAMAAPGGNVYVTTSLMRFAQNQDELAAVLCHEVSHDIHHDVVNEQQKDRKCLRALRHSRSCGDRCGWVRCRRPIQDLLPPGRVERRSYGCIYVCAGRFQPVRHGVVVPTHGFDAETIFERNVEHGDVFRSSNRRSSRFRPGELVQERPNDVRPLRSERINRGNGAHRWRPK